MKNTNNTTFVRKPTEPRVRNWKHNCAQCGQEFYSVRKDALYCSPYCKTAHRREKVSNNSSTPAEAPKTPKERKWKEVMSWECYHADWRYNQDVANFREYVYSKYKIGKSSTTTYPETKRTLSKHPQLKLVREKKTGYLPKFTMYESIQ